MRGIVPLVICGRGGAFSRLAVLEDVIGLEAGEAGRWGVPTLARLEDELEAETRRPHVKVAEPTREVVLARGGVAVPRGRLLGQQVSPVCPQQLKVGRQTGEGFASEVRRWPTVSLRWAQERET